jgi:hypothetical protein
MKTAAPWFAGLGFVLLLLALAGCQALEGKSRWDVSFHLTEEEADGRGSPLLARVRDLNDDATHVIRRMPLISSEDILAARMVASPSGEVAVEFILEPFHRHRWLQVFTEHGGRRVAVCVNGYYRFLWRLPREFDPEDCTVVVRGPWDPQEAKLIVGDADGD